MDQIELNRWITYNQKGVHNVSYEASLQPIEFQARLIESGKIIDSGSEFFILWNPESSKPPRMVFGTEEHAWRVAENMAAKNVGSRFFVMKSEGHAVTTQPVTRIKPITQATITTAGTTTRKGVAAKPRSKK